MADSPGSPLSSLASDDLIEDLKTDDRERSIDATAHGADTLLMPPSKRQKTTATLSDARTSSPMMDAPVAEVEISSDSSGDVPGSPATLAMLPDEDPSGHDQVTVCGWERCTAGDLGNMDRLVEHIHTDHIGIRQKKYSCEWFDCTRKGMPHASGYALRAHMRSHTREKPFFCTLPGKQEGRVGRSEMTVSPGSRSPDIDVEFGRHAECDRSFTRSDALAKHMRTVHETEALRPSDPVPKNHSHPPNKVPRLKLILSAKPPDGPPPGGRNVGGEELSPSAEESAPHHAKGHDLGPLDTVQLNALAAAAARMQPAQEIYPAELGFTEQEMAMAPRALSHQLRREYQRLEADRDELQTEMERLERRHKKEWMLKELLLENNLEEELALYTNLTRTRRRPETKHGTMASSEHQPTNADDVRIHPDDRHLGYEQVKRRTIIADGEGDEGHVESREPPMLPISLPRSYPSGDEPSPMTNHRPAKGTPIRTRLQPQLHPATDHEMSAGKGKGKQKGGATTNFDWFLTPEDVLG